MSSKKTVVICGSFHREPENLATLIDELEQTNCQVISPFTTTFSDRNAPFVRSKNDEGFSNIEIERFHLRAIKEADFIWLFAPQGYVGASASFEIGYAHALQKQIFSHTVPNEEYVRAIVTTVPSVYAAIKLSTIYSAANDSG